MGCHSLCFFEGNSITCGQSLICFSVWEHRTSRRICSLLLCSSSSGAPPFQHSSPLPPLPPGLAFQGIIRLVGAVPAGRAVAPLSALPCPAAVEGQEGKDPCPDPVSQLLPGPQKTVHFQLTHAPHSFLGASSLVKEPVCQKPLRVQLFLSDGAALG